MQYFAIEPPDIFNALDIETPFAASEDFNFAAVNELGIYILREGAIDRHIEKILALPLVDVAAIKAKDYKVVIDCVNSTGGIAVPKLLNALGVTKITQLYCEPDGHFPHNPEPLPENLTEIAEVVKKKDAHLGIEASISAGMRVVVLTSSYGADVLAKADQVVNKFEEIN